ncbi:hypothetical protein JKP88DRAFT_226185 [Tribonema minus]|uniref:Uncharacterized protein n=1 Tax=Tribonema minus TaxID=303371 RepID=A0A835YMW1_9STRA|nr:hypothetical protein JKP88DRAFT_226185 [Tribonema minus]
MTLATNDCSLMSISLAVSASFWTRACHLVGGNTALSFAPTPCFAATASGCARWKSCCFSELSQLRTRLPVDMRLRSTCCCSGELLKGKRWLGSKPCTPPPARGGTRGWEALTLMNAGEATAGLAAACAMCFARGMALLENVVANCMVCSVWCRRVLLSMPKVVAAL